MTDTTQRTAYALSRIAHHIRYASLPEKVVGYAKHLILDSISCILGGVNRIQGEKIITLARAMAGTEEAGICGTDLRVPLFHSVYANAYLSTILDYDDTYDGHPGSTIIPVALPMGEVGNITGKEFIEAVVAGYETGIRVSNGIKPTPERTKHVRGINTWQIFCAAATASRLYGLDMDKTAHALSHAAIHAPVPTLRKWGFADGRIQWLKNNFGWTACAGVLSAWLAQSGFPGDTTIFDGHDGFWIMASSDQCNYEAMTESPDKFYTLSVHLKPYPACRHIHPTLDAVFAIMEEGPVTPEEIQSIHVHTFYEVVNDYTFLPAVPFDVCFSAPFLIALALSGYAPGPGWHEEARIEDEKIRSLATKVVFHEWEEASKAYPLVNRELMSRVEIELAAGETRSKTVRIPKGDPRNPLTDAELREKFDTTALPVLGREKAEQVFEMVMNLENLDSVRKLTDILVP